MFELTVANIDDEGNNKEFTFYFHTEDDAYEALQHIEEKSNFSKVEGHWIEVYPNAESFNKFFDEEILGK